MSLGKLLANNGWGLQDCWQFAFLPNYVGIFLIKNFPICDDETAYPNMLSGRKIVWDEWLVH